MVSMVSNITEGVLSGIKNQIVNLQEKNAKLKSRVKALKFILDKAEQYGRRICLRLSGLTETQSVSVDTKVMELANAVGADLTIKETTVTYYSKQGNLINNPLDRATSLSDLPAIDRDRSNRTRNPCCVNKALKGCILLRRLDCR